MLYRKYKTLELYLTYECNLKCLYCFGEDKVNGAEDIVHLEFDKAARVMAAARRAGHNLVTLIGGEPTVYPDFFRVLRLAKKLGFCANLYTNGVSLDDMALLRRMRDAGLDTVSINLPDYRERQYDLQTGVKGSHRRVLKAIENINVLGMPFQSILVVNKVNYRGIPEYVDFYSRLGLKLVTAQYLLFTGRLRKEDANIKLLGVPVSKTIPYVEEGSRRLLAAGGYPFFYVHVQACFFRRYMGRVATMYLEKPESAVCLYPDTSAEKLEKVAYKHRSLPEVCRKCSYYARCTGIEAKYMEFFGTREIKPITSAPDPFWADYSDKDWVRRSKLDFSGTFNDMFRSVRGRLAKTAPRTR